jgi:hypothetical protein
MKYNFLFLLCFGLSTSLFGQSDSWYFSFNLGGSWPIGTFARNTVTDPNAGFAGRGFSLSVDASYPVGDNLALKGMVLLNNNPVNRYWQLTQLVNRMTKFIPISSQDQQFLSMTVNPWVWNGLMFGPNYTITFDKFLWDFQALGGLNVAYLPQQKLLYQNPANSWLFLYHNLNTVSVSYGLLGGTAVRFPVSDKIYLRIGIDYYHSQATLKFEELRVTKEGLTTTIDHLSTGRYSVPIENISGTIGFVYYLN